MELSVRKLGNSAGIILPSALLKTMRLTVGSALNAEQVKGKLVLTPALKPRYTLDELIAQCDAKAPVPADMKAWVAMEAVGKEIV